MGDSRDDPAYQRVKAKTSNANDIAKLVKIVHEGTRDEQAAAKKLLLSEHGKRKTEKAIENSYLGAGAKAGLIRRLFGR